jgi:hypothetical protein
MVASDGLRGGGKIEKKAVPQLGVQTRTLPDKQ